MLTHLLIISNIIVSTVHGATINPPPPQREDQTEYWINAAKKFVNHQTQSKQNKNTAKNVIIFMGDGMSMSTLAATRPYIGGEEVSLSFEEFPAVGMVKTYCVDYQTADSSCAATAILSGTKSNFGTIGVTASVNTSDCLANLNANGDGHTKSIAQWAMDAGKVAGFVTTSRVTDAGPASLYAHSGSRFWENDVDVRAAQCNPGVTTDLASQMIRSEVGRKLKVIMGGGRGQFRNSTVIDEEGQPGRRADGRNLVNEWIDAKNSDRAAYVWNAVKIPFTFMCKKILNE